MLAGAPAAGAAANGARRRTRSCGCCASSSAGPTVAYLRVEKDDTLVEWRREGSPGAA